MGRGEEVEDISKRKSRFRMHPFCKNRKTDAFGMTGGGCSFLLSENEDRVTGGQEATGNSVIEVSVEGDVGELVVGEVVLIEKFAEERELRDEGAEDSGFLLWLEVVGAEGGGDEPTLAGAIGVSFGFGFEGAGASEDDEEVEM